jgi:hypothetical protein
MNHDSDLVRHNSDLENHSRSDKSGPGSLSKPDLLDLSGRLHPRQKVSLIKSWITQLPSRELEALQKMIANEEQDRLKREGEAISPSTVRGHRLKIKKDYGFRRLELTLPQQYFVSIGQRYKIHNDIYLGVLFFVREGYTLNYVVSKQGAIQFNPQTNVFRLESTIDRRQKFVRLLLLTPPPPEYDVKQIEPATYMQVPCFLHVEILNASLEVVERERYQFPACMFRQDAFDRDYWNIVTVISPENVPGGSPGTNLDLSVAASATTAALTTALANNPRVILHSKMSPTAFTITNKAKVSLLTSFLRHLVSLSQKAFPEAPWSLDLHDLNYRLLHSSKKLIVEIKVNSQEVILGETALSVLSEWCRSLGVEVSQNVYRTHYSDRDKTVARNLMLEFSATVTDPMVFLHKFFFSVKGVQFKPQPPKR